MVEKIIRLLYYSLFFATPLLMFPLTSELFEFNKMMFIYLIAILVGFTWILKMSQEKKLIFKRTPLDLPIILFLTSQILATIFSIDKLTSLFGYYGRFNGGLASLIAYIVLFYGFVTFSDLFKKEKLLKISLTSSAISLLWGLPGRLGYDLTCWVFTGDLSNSCWTNQFRPSERMFSTLGQPNWFGAYLAINFFIGLYFFMESILKKNGKSHFVYLAYLALNFAGVIFTRSRSSLFALLIGLVVFSVILIYKNRRKVVLKVIGKKAAPLILIVLAIVAIFKTGVARVDKYLEFGKKQPEVKVEKVQQSQTSSEVSESFDIRKIVWKGAIDLGFKYPLFGTGVETFAYSYYFVRPTEHNLTSEWDYLYNKAHNEYLNYFANTGFSGLLTYLLLIVISVSVFSRKIVKDKNLLTAALFSSYLVILITNFFGFSVTTINIYFYLLPGFLFFNIKRKEKKLPLLEKKSKAFLIGGLLGALYLIYSLIQYYNADLKYATSQNYSQIGDYQTASTLLDKSLSLKKEHVYEDKLSYALANLAFVAAYQKDTDITKSLAGLSQTYNARSLQKSPKNVLYWKTKAKNHYLFYQIDLDEGQLLEGINAINQAADLSPTDPKIPYTAAIFYSLLEDEVKDSQKKIEYQDKALEEVEKSIKLKPDFRDGLLLKGQLLKKYGNRQGAIRIFKLILEKINPNDMEVKEELAD